jgi:hypothetical protein
MAALALVSLAAGFGLGRLTPTPPLAPALGDIDSFRRALDDPDWLDRMYLQSAFLRHLDAEKLPAALEALRERELWLGSEELRLFMFAWARFDPRTAFARALAWPGPLRRRASGAAIYAWAYRDPLAARGALASVEDPNLRSWVHERLVAGWARRDPDEAIDYVASLASGPERLRLSTVLAEELVRDGPDRVTGWVETLPDGGDGYKRSAFEEASAVLAAIDAPRTAHWVEAHVAYPYAEGAPIRVAERWQTHDPAAALEWLAGLPARDERDAAIVSGFRRWLRDRPEEAKTWLYAHSPQPRLDLAVRVVARRTSAADPGTAVEWAERIHAPALREASLTQLGRYWLRTDPQRAQAWLDEAELSEEVRRAISKREGKAPAADSADSRSPKP